MKGKQNQKGITLIALVITIIILLILAGVTINIVFNDGIAEKSQTAVDQYKIEEYKEKIEIIKTGEQLKKIADRLPETLKELVVRNLRSDGNKSWVEIVETDEDDAGLEENEIKVITTDSYIIIAEIDENGNIKYEISKDDGEPYPSVEAEVQPLEGTENEKRKIQVKAEVEKIKKTKKIAKIELIKDGTIIETREYNKLKVEDTFEVEEDGTYIIKAITDQEKTRSKKVETISKINIVAETTNPRNTEKTGTQNGIETGPITVTITYGNNNYTRQYKIGDGNWQVANDVTQKIEVKENTEITARYFDGANAIKEEKYNIQNVDNVAPTFTNYDVTLSGTTITATGTAIDTASTGATSGIEGVEKYQYSKDGTNYQDENTFEVTTAGNYTIYIKAIDKAGNERIVNKTLVIAKEVNSYYDTYVTTYSSKVNTTILTTSTSYSTKKIYSSSFVRSTTYTSTWVQTSTWWAPVYSNGTVVGSSKTGSGTGGTTIITSPVYSTKTSTSTSTIYYTSKNIQTTYYSSTTSSLTDRKTTYYISK